jgi:hypothetical protein
VTKIRSPQITGLECPLPGSSTFQATLLVSLQRTGAVPAATPVCDGPRQ